MILLKRFIPWFTGAVIGGGFILLLRNPNLIWWIAGGLFLVLSGAIYSLVDIKNKWERIVSQEFFNFLIILVFFVFSGLGFILFLEGDIYIWIISGLVSFFAVLYLEYIFILFFRTVYYTPASLENICSYIGFITFFLLFSNSYNLYMWLGVNLLSLSLLILISLLLLVNQIMWVNKIKFAKSWVYTGIIVIILVELFWAVGFLPTNAYVSGLTVAIGYYLAVSITRLSLLNSLTVKVVGRYLIAGLGAIALILLTAKW